MNKECYEVGRKYCAVMSDDGEVRVLSKNHPDNFSTTTQFDELLILENFLEETENKKNDILKKYEELKTLHPSAKSRFKLALGVTILMFCGGFFGLAQCFEGTALLKGLFGVGFYSILLPLIGVIETTIVEKLENKKEKKKLIEELSELEKTIQIVKGKIESAKKEIQVETVIAPEFSKETNKQINAIIEKDELSARLNREKQARILRTMMNSYLEDKNILVEKGYQYSLDVVKNR